MYVDESSLVERAETDKKVTALFVIQSNMENLLCKKSSRFPCLVIETVAALDKPLDELQKITEKDLLGIYRDSLKTMGLPMFNSGPLQD